MATDSTFGRPSFSERQQSDMDLYTRWRQTKDPDDLSDLMDNLSPLIQTEVRRQSGTLPESALSAEAKHWTIRALQTYDPSKGAAIGTHVQSYLPKLRRMNYKFQNSARLPENLQLKFRDYNAATQNLTDRLNREPSDDEIAQEIGWSPKKVANYRNSLYADLYESGSDQPGQTDGFNWDKVKLDHLRSQLSPEENKLWDNSNLPNARLAEIMGVNVNRLNYLKSTLRKKAKGILDDFEVD